MIRRMHSFQVAQCRLSEARTTKPKVLIIIATDPIGGPGKGLFQFFEYAPPEAFDYILCNYTVRNRPVGQFIQEARRRGLNLVLLDQRAMIDPRLILQARHIIRQHGINLIQTHGYKANLTGFVLHMLCGKPWIGFAHGYTDDNWKVRLYNRIDQSVLRCADKVVAVSSPMKSLLMRCGVQEKNLRTIYNAIECNPSDILTDAIDVKKRHRIPEDQKVIGVIGRLSPEKGQLVFLKAMAKAVRTFPGMIALIVGEGQDQAILLDYCHKNNLNGHVVFTGYQENIGDYYQALDLLVLPSHSEGLPNTVLEAMSYGIPVLATAVGGVPEIIDKGNGVLVPPNDPDALADRMIELLRDDSMRQAIGQRGKGSLYPRFSPTERAHEIIGVYREVLLSRR